MPNDSEHKMPGGPGGASFSADGTVRVDRAAVAVLVGAAERFAEEASLEVGAKERFLILVEEITANIISHGRPPPDSVIAYRFVADQTALAVTFEDAGVEFDPRQEPAGSSSEKVEPPGDPERQALVEGGQGWPLIRSWCRIVRYRREGGRNYLELAMPLR